MTATCPRCGAFIASDAQVTDTPNGIVVVIEEPVPTARQHCICGWTWTVASASCLIRQPHLTLIEGVA